MKERDQREETTAGWKKDAVALALLLALVLPLRVWLLTSAVATSRDGIGYIRYALEFEQFSWQEVCKKNHQHPGYPLTVLAVSEPLRWLTGATDPATMQLAGQLTSMIAVLILLYPMYHLGRLLFDRRVGFGAALLFQYLPSSAHHLSDGISESLFVMLVAATLLQAVRALHGGGWRRFALCGLCGGLAYLTRPEGALILIAVVPVLVAMQIRPAWRLPWRQFVASGAALVLVWAACASLYVYATGRITNKISVIMVIDMLTAPLHQLHADAGGGPLFAITFTPSSHSSVQLARSARALGLEVSNGFHYLGVVPAALGLLLSFGTLRRLPGFWMITLYCMVHATILLALALTVSYVSDRHVMVLVLCGSSLASAGLCELPRWLLRSARLHPRSLLLHPACWSAVLFAGMIGFCLPKTLVPLHTNRHGNRAAGEWLAEQFRAGDYVDDDHCWSHYYAGMVFLENRDPPPAQDHQPMKYVVITRAHNRAIGEVRRQREERLKDDGASVVYHWPCTASEDDARVVVYARPRRPDDRPEWASPAPE
jgi:4-amino-4-deoxy-L-arabinose transferase-like glycosyltransferase